MSTPQNETPIRPGSNKLSRPFKAEALRRHIEDSITKQAFLLLPNNCDPDPVPVKLDDDPETLKSCSSYISTILAVKKPEHAIYLPLTKLLTVISRFVHGIPVDKPRTSALTNKDSVLMFITRSGSIQEAADGEIVRPDISGVEATAEEVAKYLEEDVLPDRFSSLRWSQIVSVGEVKLTEMPKKEAGAHFLQLLSYVWCANRYQPNRFTHTALLAYKTGFITLHCHPDSAVISLKSSYEALVRYVYDVYYPPSGATQRSEFSNLKPIQPSSDDGKKKTVAIALKPTFRYAVRGDTETNGYSVFDLFHGSGFGRQAYVGLGARMTTDRGPPQVIILKVYCRDHARRFREEVILQKIHKDGHLPGVPRICEDISEQPFLLPQMDPEPVREACMISLATTGENLSMCKNVLQFFKAMYDLTEVHRMLVEKKHILHRDISWSNILINHRHFEAPNEDICGFHFIDNILKELTPRVQVVLTDFDNALIIQGPDEGTDGHAESRTRGITGTPAFIAEVLARPSPPIADEDIPFQHVQNLNNNITPHPVKDRYDSDVEFFEKLAKYEHLDVDTPLLHQAIHDAESIFWVIVFFMIRANPEGSVSSGTATAYRSEAFDAIMGHRIGAKYSSRAPLLQNSPKDWEELLPEKLQGFAGTLYRLSRYFKFPWHVIQVPVTHQFHAHNLLQRLLIHEIRQLTEEVEDGIQLGLVPLPVQSQLPLTQLSGALSFSVHQLKRPSTADREVTPSKRRKHNQSQTGDGDGTSPCLEPGLGQNSSFAAIDILAARTQDAISSYEILPSTVQDDTIRSLIQNIRTSIDIQKLWFTGNARSRIVFPPQK